MEKNSFNVRESHIWKVEYVLILAFSVFPVFLHFPYRINIFLSWEGAYRLYLGQVPYRDFGLPMGFGFWIIPAIFFKIFGPYMITLLKAQAFINIISAIAFRSVLKTVSVSPPVRLLSVLLFLVSFSFVNFWPWYNHTVIVFELVGLAFLLKYIFKKEKKFRLWPLFLASFFLFMALFTKQDAGALAFLIGLALIICHSIYEKKVWPLMWFLLFYMAIALAVIVPFIPHHIGYWFNYGQPPHYDRLSLYDIFDIFFGKSEWIKFYLLVIILILAIRCKNFREAVKDKKFIVFALLVLGIIAEAAIFQVTSYIPEYNNIFFHSFAIAFIFSFSSLTAKVDFRKLAPLCLTALLILLWWSSRPWQYANRIVMRYLPRTEKIDTNEVSIHTYLRKQPGQDWSESLTPNRSAWKYTPWKVFKNISMPAPTIAGINRLLDRPVIKNNGKDLKVLNMTELTPLAEVIGYIPETGADIPLWYHKNVAMYGKEIREYDNRIKANYYDLVLFEYAPLLNNFYPFEIRDTLKKYYDQVDVFSGPRSNDYSIIEVYLKKPTDEEKNY
jgi:hypothetical protein